MAKKKRPKDLLKHVQSESQRMSRVIDEMKAKNRKRTGPRRYML